MCLRALLGANSARAAVRVGGSRLTRRARRGQQQQQQQQQQRRQRRRRLRAAAGGEMQVAAWRERASQAGAFVDHAPVDPTGAAYARAVPAAPEGPLQGRTFAAKVRVRLKR